MKIPKYWAKGDYNGVDNDGERFPFRVWGWSSESAAAARAAAEARAKQVFDWWVNKDKPKNWYDYLDLPMREEIIDTIKFNDEETAVITRNRYGSLVLNCASVCFVDVDYPEAKSNGIWDAIKLMFSAELRQQRKEELKKATIEKMKNWGYKNSKRSFRIYKTAAGLRLLFTDALYDPASDEVKNLLDELGSDEMYRRLTNKQKCFRARLTAKPWRIGCQRPPNRYPWKDSQEENKYRKWQTDYESKAGNHNVCELVQEFGRSSSDERINAVVALHDKHTCSKTGAALA